MNKIKMYGGGGRLHIFVDGYEIDVWLNTATVDIWASHEGYADLLGQIDFKRETTHNMKPELDLEVSFISPRSI